MSATRLAYTFGNHMHWVDMQWLWGYHVLPGSVRDMLHFCRETGARGGVNFDGIGYEKLACEHPEAFAELRAAIREGTVEVVGASYGQPYGLFHGGESNVRQRIYGIRTAERLFGVRPKTFWEEEFDCYPQLPQILRGCGFEGASLYFQWTWHTPEVPKEDTPVIWWEGHDGTRIKTATRNRLNVHQWPEDIAILMDDLAVNPPEQGLILQWLELMPSPDWMCRSEVLLPKTKELLSDPRFEFDLVTLGEYLASVGDDWPVRRYSLTDTWHGMSLGKNADRHPRMSFEVERQILGAEALYSVLGRFGRPYAQWDVYPTWELEEAWRNLLAAQHHDNHECEALCGRVGYAQLEMARTLADAERGLALLARRVKSSGSGELLFNPSGWARTYDSGKGPVSVPAFGYAVIEPCDQDHTTGWTAAPGGAVCQGRDYRVLVDVEHWTARIETSERSNTFALPEVIWKSGGQSRAMGKPEISWPKKPDQDLAVQFRPDEDVFMWFRLHPFLPALEITVSFEPLTHPLDPGLLASAQTVWMNHPNQIRVDHPYAVSEVSPTGDWPRKYPTGDWMTSPQWFETISQPFTSQHFVDLVAEDGSGLLIFHSGSQQWFRREVGVHNVLVMKDPWDEDGASTDGRTSYRVYPHGPITDSERVRLAATIDPRDRAETWRMEENPEGDLPPSYGFATCEPANVLMTALYREVRQVTGGIDYPYLVRLVEYDGIDSEVELRIFGTVATAAKTDLLGERATEVRLSLGSGEFGPESTLRFSMRAHEIATVTFDVVEAQKQVRDLDAKREVWATVHRQGS